MSDFVELRLESTIKNRMSMPMQIDPDGRRAVEISFPFGIDEVGTFPALDDEGIFLFPLLHLGKRMPEVAMVPVDQLSR